MLFESQFTKSSCISFQRQITQELCKTTKVTEGVKVVVCLDAQKNLKY